MTIGKFVFWFLFSIFLRIFFSFMFFGKHNDIPLLAFHAGDGRCCRHTVDMTIALSEPLASARKLMMWCLQEVSTGIEVLRNGKDFFLFGDRACVYILGSRISGCGK